METIRKGIIASFSGKIGTIVDKSKKVISHMRSLPLSVKKVNAKAQASKRTKFAIALNMLISMTTFLRASRKLHANKQSVCNAVTTRAGANLKIVRGDNSGFGSAKQTNKALIPIPYPIEAQSRMGRHIINHILQIAGQHGADTTPARHRHDTNKTQTRHRHSEYSKKRAAAKTCDNPSLIYI